MSLAERATNSLGQAGGYLRTGYDYGQTTIERRNGRSIGWMIVGYSLLAILVYIAIANKPVVAAIGGASTLGSRIVTAWVKPVDPVAAITGSLALTGGAPSSGATTAGAAAASQGEGSAAPALHPAPSPKTIARTPISRLPRRSNSPGTAKLWSELRRRALHEGVLHA